MIWKTLHLYGFCSPENSSLCFATLRLQCKSQSDSSLVTCYLFFRCGIGRESLSSGFSTTLTHTRRLLQTNLSLFVFFPRYQCNSHTHTHRFFWHMAQVYSERCRLPFMPDVISDWRWCQAVFLLLRVTYEGEAWKLSETNRQANYESIWCTQVPVHALGLRVMTQVIGRL